MSQLKYVLTTLLLTPCAFIWAQPTTVAAIDSKAQFFCLDALNNVYITAKNNELTKHSKGVQVGNFRNAVWGKPSSVDATNPSEIAVFYPDAALIIMLDQRLNNINNISLQNIFDNETAVICRSFDNNFWLYHETAFRLKKIDGNANIMIDAERVPQVIQNHKPLQIAEHRTQVFLLLDDLGILVFDLFGNYLKTIATPKITHFSVYKNELSYIYAHELQIYDLGTGVASTKKLPEFSVLQQESTELGSFFLTEKSVILPPQN